jgi:SAM-dependent methyltransferase
LWKDRFRNFFGEGRQPDALSGKSSAHSPVHRHGGTASLPGKTPSGVISRSSSGAEQFFASLRNDESLSILDLSGANQANISFITDLGHRLSSEDILSSMDQCFGDGDFIENQASASRAQRFFDQSLTFPESHFDGVLVWDTLQFFAPPLLEHVVARLLRIMRPGGLMLAFFSANDKTTQMPVYNYRLQDQRTLLMTPRGAHRQIQYFNNRMIERLFEDAQAVKFFLSRDHLREVIVRR